MSTAFLKYWFNKLSCLFNRFCSNLVIHCRLCSIDQSHQLSNSCPFYPPLVDIFHHSMWQPLPSQGCPLLEGEGKGLLHGVVFHLHRLLEDSRFQLMLLFYIYLCIYWVMFLPAGYHYFHAFSVQVQAPATWSDQHLSLKLHRLELSHCEHHLLMYHCTNTQLPEQSIIFWQQSALWFCGNIQHCHFQIAHKNIGNPNVLKFLLLNDHLRRGLFKKVCCEMLNYSRKIFLW